MLPDKLGKSEGWRRWKMDVEDYAEEIAQGMKQALDKVRKMKEPVQASHVDPDMWDMRSTLYRFLKRYTSDQVHQVVENCTNENGWEAWRLLEAYCEPAVGVREAQVMGAYTSMASHRAKNAKETRKLMADLEQKLSEYWKSLVSQWMFAMLRVSSYPWWTQTP